MTLLFELTDIVELLELDSPIIFGSVKKDLTKDDRLELHEIQISRIHRTHLAIGVTGKDKNHCFLLTPREEPVLGETHDLLQIVARKNDCSREDSLPLGMEAQHKFCDDSEITTTSTDTEKQICVFHFVRRANNAIGINDRYL